MSVLRRELRARRTADFSEEGRLRSVASDEDSRSRNLAQAREFYSDAANRLRGLTAADVQHMSQSLDTQLMARWGYAHPPVALAAD